MSDLEKSLDEFLLICQGAKILEYYPDDYYQERDANVKINFFKFQNENLFLTIKKVYDDQKHIFDEGYSGTWFWQKGPRNNPKYVTPQVILNEFRNAKVKNFVLFNFNYIKERPKWLM